MLLISHKREGSHLWSWDTGSPLLQTQATGAPHSRTPPAPRGRPPTPDPRTKPHPVKVRAACSRLFRAADSKGWRGVRARSASRLRPLPACAPPRGGGRSRTGRGRRLRRRLRRRRLRRLRRRGRQRVALGASPGLGQRTAALPRGAPRLESRTRAASGLAGARPAAEVSGGRAGRAEGRADRGRVYVSAAGRWGAAPGVPPAGPLLRGGAARSGCPAARNAREPSPGRRVCAGDPAPRRQAAPRDEAAPADGMELRPEVEGDRPGIKRRLHPGF